MKEPTEQEMIDLVRELNGEIYDNAGEEELQFGYSTNGNMRIIDFAGFTIWCDDHDGYSKEDFAKYIRTKFNFFASRLNKLKFK